MMTVTMVMRRKSDNDAEDDFDDSMFAFSFSEFLWFGTGPTHPNPLEFEHAELGDSTLRTYGWPNFPTSIVTGRFGGDMFS